jgi:hypothetical protein
MTTARSWLRSAIAISIVAGSITLAGPARQASAACASPTKSLSGTLTGEDGQLVSGFIGISLYDSSSRRLDINGCLSEAGGYDVTTSVNKVNGCCYTLDHNGVPPGTPGYSAGWSLSGLPSNAAYGSFESYPKSKSEPPAGHATSFRRYGASMRRLAPLSSPFALKLPLNCGIVGHDGDPGTNGAISGRVFVDGKPVAPTRVGIWSQAPDGPNPVMGFGVLGDGKNPIAGGGTFTTPPLAAGQPYTLQITAGGKFKQYYSVRVESCATTPFSVDLTRGAAPGGTDTPGIVRDAAISLRNANSSGPVDVGPFNYGAPGDTYLIGDWNRDGVDTIGVRRGNSFYLRNTNTSGPANTSFSFGAASDVAFVGDWNGDGVDTIGIRRGATWYLRNANTSGAPNVTFSFGVASDTPVVGDWNRDGVDTIGIRRGATWYLRNSNSSGAPSASLAFGLESDLPLIGDWNGDGVDTVGVRRGAIWYLRNTNSSGPSSASFGFGVADDQPLVGDWNGF